jgi:hypothetical protein
MIILFDKEREGYANKPNHLQYKLKDSNLQLFIT